MVHIQKYCLVKQSKFLMHYFKRYVRILNVYLYERKMQDGGIQNGLFKPKRV